MSLESLPRLVLGHNQFFGVDHLSAQRGSQRAAYFSNNENVLEIVKFAHAQGAGGLMLSTHPRSVDICDALSRDSELSESLQIFPLLPYAQKYVTKANEVGMVRAVTGTFANSSLLEKLALGGDFFRILIRRNPIDMVRSLIRLELGMFRKLNTPVVFLHDAIVDLLVALSMPQVFEVFATTLRKHVGARVGIATKNLPFVASRFSEWGMEIPVILTHVNKVGFHVNPSVATQEAILMKPGLEVMAMGALASGYLIPSEAAEYVRRFPAVKSVVVGASSKEHISETASAFLKP